jgi:hypothetical protein
MADLNPPPPSSEPPPAYMQSFVSTARITALEHQVAQLESQGKTLARVLSSVQDQQQANAHQLAEVKALLLVLAENQKTGSESTSQFNEPATTQTPLVRSSNPTEHKGRKAATRRASNSGTLGGFLTPATTQRQQQAAAADEERSRLAAPHSAVKLERLITGMGLSTLDDEEDPPSDDPESDDEFQGKLRKGSRHRDLTKLIHKPTEFRGGASASPLATIQWVRAMDKFLSLQGDLDGVTRGALASSYLKEKAEFWLHAWLQSRGNKRLPPATWSELAKALLKKHKCHLLEERSRRQLSLLQPCKKEENVERYLREFDNLRLNCFTMKEEVLMQRLYDLTIGVPHIYEKTQVEFHTFSSVDDMLDRLYDLEEVHFQAYGRSGRGRGAIETSQSNPTHHLNALRSMELNQKNKAELRKLLGEAPKSDSLGRPQGHSVLLCFGCGKPGHRADADSCPNKALRDADDADYRAALQERLAAWQKSRRGGRPGKQ